MTDENTENTPMPIADLLFEMVLPFADKPDEIEIEPLGTEDNVIKFRVRVADEDVGAVIGRKGATIRAIEEYLRRVAAKDRSSVNVSVFNPKDSR